MVKKNDNSLDLGDLGALDVDLDTGLPAVISDLTDEDRRSLDAEARREVAVELKAKKMEEYKAAAKKELKRQHLATANVSEEGEELEDIRIELAKYTLYIMLDGRVYYNGYTYKFGRKQAAVVKDQIYRSWLHDAEVHGMDINEMNGRHKYLQTLRPR